MLASGPHVTMSATSSERRITTLEVTMPALSTWNLDPTKLLTRCELANVLADLGSKAGRSASVQRNLVVVRLACCCGLWVSEMAALQIDDMQAC